MNPLTNVKNLQKLNDRELELGIIGKKSWHDEYKDSAWVFIGGLPFDLSEGDIICVFSQYGEIVNLNLVRDHKTGKSKGFAFLCYEDQRSTVLAVDNLNGIKILGRIIRVDHVKDYKVPKEHGDEDELVMKIRNEGCAPKIESSSDEEMEDAEDKDEKKAKKDKKKKKKEKIKKKKKKRKGSSSPDSESSDDSDEGDRKKTEITVKPEVKQEKYDKGYDKALNNNSSGGFRHHSGAGNSRDRSRPKQKNTDKSQGHGKNNRHDSSDENDDNDDSSDERNVKNSNKYMDRSPPYSSHSRDSHNDRSEMNSSKRGRDRSRDKERDRDRSRDREKERGGNRDRDTDFSRNRDRERDGDMFGDREKGSNRYENRERGRNDDRERDRNRYEDRQSERDRNRYEDRERNDGKERDGDRNGYGDRDRQR